MKVILYKYKGKLYSDKPFNTRVVGETYDKDTLTVHANCVTIISFLDVFCLIAAIAIFLVSVFYKPVQCSVNVNPNSYYSDGKLYCNINYDIPSYLGCCIEVFDEQNNLVYTTDVMDSGLISYIDVPESSIYKVDAYLKLYNFKISKRFNVIISSEGTYDNEY